jgi:hypothetical protein
MAIAVVAADPGSPGWGTWCTAATLNMHIRDLTSARRLPPTNVLSKLPIKRLEAVSVSALPHSELNVELAFYCNLT